MWPKSILGLQKMPLKEAVPRVLTQTWFLQSLIWSVSTVVTSDNLLTKVLDLIQEQKKLGVHLL